MPRRILLYPGLVGLLALGSAGVAVAQSDVPFTVSSEVAAFDAVVEKVAAMPRFGAAAARRDAVRQAVRQARAAGLPSVTIDASVSSGGGDFDAGPTGTSLLEQVLGGADGGSSASAFDTLGAVDTRQARVSVVQPVFTGFRIRNGISQAKALVSAADADFELTRQSLIVELVDASLSVATAVGQRETAAKSVELLGRQVRAAQVAFEAGQGTRTDIALANAQRAAADARLAASAAQVIAAQGRLAALIGPVEAQRFTPDLVVLPPPSDVEDAVAMALERHPAVLAAEALAQADAAAQRVAEGGRSPSIQLRGSVSASENQFLPGDSSTNTTNAAEVSVPLFRGGAIGADIARARAEARASRFGVVDRRRQIETGVRSAYAGYTAADLSLAAAEARLEATELAYRGVTLEQEVGQRTLLDVLRVEEDLQAARGAVLEARQAAVIASLRLRQAIGTLGD